MRKVFKKVEGNRTRKLVLTYYKGKLSYAEEVFEERTGKCKSTIHVSCRLAALSNSDEYVTKLKETYELPEETVEEIKKLLFEPVGV